MLNILFVFVETEFKTVQLQNKTLDKFYTYG